MVLTTTFPLINGDFKITNMKILFIVTTFPVLSQTFVLNQITGLVDQGCEVDILAMIKGREAKIQSDIIKYNLLDSTYYFDDILRQVPIKKILRLREFIILFKNNFLKRPKALLKSLNAFRLGVEAVTLKTFYTTVSFIDKGPYDIVHCHFGPNGRRGIYLREIGAIDGKIITAFHGYDLTSHIRQKKEHIYSKVFSKSDLIMPISHIWRNKLIKMGCNKNKIIVHRMGIDTEKLNPKINNRKGKKHFKVLSVGRFVEKKGFTFSIKAVARAVVEFKNISYEIIGNGELRQEYTKLIKQLKANDYINILGWRNTEEVIDIMKDADILLAPSITSQTGDQEGIPVVIMEAMALGLAVISTKHSGIPELVKNGKSGFLVNEKDTEELKNKLIFFAENPEKIDEMGKVGRRIVCEEFDIHKLNYDLYKTYKLILSGK